ncbi:MAG: VWA domain-containing protein [Candidatus Kapabacteria bacterium]|nr:VWA domain-containing protein [Candidatus Kapabacteria bacterium]
MKKILLLLFVALYANLISQTIKVIGVDASNYPKMKAEFIIKDSTGKELRDEVLISNLSLIDAYDTRTITNKFCEFGKYKFSLVLTLDKSASMLDDINGNAATKPNRKIDAAMNSAKALIDGLPGYLDNPLADVALTAFSAGPVSNVPFFRPHDILKWFTYNRDSLKKEIDLIKPVGATDYNVAFLGNSSLGVLGIMDLCEVAKYKPVVIFVTDGEHNPPAPFKPVNVTEIVTRAKRSGTTIYAITIGLATNPELTAITSQTGGIVYENLKNEDDISAVYFDILSKSNIYGKQSPCTFEWETKCDGARGELSISKPIVASTTFTYYIDKIYKPTLNVVPTNLYFSNSGIGVPQTKNITLTAINRDVQFDSLPKFSNPRFQFDFNGKTFPLTLKKDASIVFKVIYTPTDTIQKGQSFTFNTSACYGNYFDCDFFKTDVNEYDNSSEYKMFYYPNPVKDFLDLDLSNINNLDLENADFKLMNPLGQTIYYQKISDIGNSNIKFDLSSIPSGLYYGIFQSKSFVNHTAIRIVR